MSTAHFTLDADPGYFDPDDTATSVKRYTEQRRVLRAVLDADRPLSTREIAARFDITRGSARRHCVNLLEAGLIEDETINPAPGRERKWW